MSWILRIIAVMFLLSSLHNFDLWSGNLIEYHFGYAVCFGSAGLIILLFEVKRELPPSKGKGLLASSGH